jgi:hypothetical protein
MKIYMFLSKPDMAQNSLDLTLGLVLYLLHSATKLTVIIDSNQLTFSSMIIVIFTSRTLVRYCSR